MAVPGPEPFYHLQSGIDAAMRIVEIRECAIRSLMWSPLITITAGETALSAKTGREQLQHMPRVRKAELFDHLVVGGLIKATIALRAAEAIAAVVNTP